MTTAQLAVLILFSCCLQFVPSYADSDELLQSWQKIKTNYANDIQQSFDVYSKIRKEQGALQDLRTIVEKHLRKKNSELLANAIRSNNITRPESNLKELVKKFHTDYSRELIEGIFADGIRDIIATNNVTQLPDLLSNIYQQNDTELFEIMVRAQVKLYSSVSKRHHPEEAEFMRLFAHKLHKISKDSLYGCMDLSLKQQVQNVMQQLPTTLKYLYFMPYFCLMNVEYSTYIYTAIDARVDAVSRYTWLWHDSRSMDNTGYIKADVGDLIEKKPSLTLKSWKYGIYYYMMQGKMKIAGWDSKQNPFNYIWTLEFLDNDRVAFTQNDYLICAVENYDNERRNVAGRKREKPNVTSSECQWRIEQCKF